MWKYKVSFTMKKGLDRRTFNFEFVAKDDEAASHSIHEYVEGKEGQSWKLVESKLLRKEAVH